MLSLPVLALFGVAWLPKVAAGNIGRNARQMIRQAPVLASDQSYINATRNDNSQVSLRIDTQSTSARNDTAPLLYGLMHEVAMPIQDLCSSY